MTWRACPSQAPAHKVWDQARTHQDWSHHLSGSFNAQHLRSLTYLVFLAGTSQDPDEGLLRLMRRQLKVGGT